VTLFVDHVLMASDDEIRAVLAAPAAFYVIRRHGDGPSQRLDVAKEDFVALPELDALHWLLSGQLPGAGDETPAAFLARGGRRVSFAADVRVDDGRRWRCEGARAFERDREGAILAAIDAADRDAFLRKGGKKRLKELEALGRLLAREEGVLLVAANACLRVPTGSLPVFDPPYPEREDGGGDVPSALLEGGEPIGGTSCYGFGLGPARAHLSATLAGLDLKKAPPELVRKVQAAIRDGMGLIAYPRMALDDLYAEAASRIRVGYLDRGDIIEELEDLFEPPSAVEVAVDVELATAALARSTWPETTDCDRLLAAFEQLRGQGFVALEHAGFESSTAYDLVAEGVAEGTRPYCFFHQQSIWRALDGDGLELCFGLATRTADGVEFTTSTRVADGVSDALCEAGLEAAFGREGWETRAEEPLVVPMLWQYRPLGSR
jgi:PAS domain-containing protein